MSGARHHGFKGFGYLMPMQLRQLKDAKFFKEINKTASYPSLHKLIQ
jgi:hypothetical protein